MNNETKWDVFEDALRALEEFGEQGSSWEMAYDDLSARYSAASDEALPDDLPVIPKVVGEILQSAQGQTDLLGMLDTARNGHKVSEPLAWIIANQNTFATAWVLGVWRVEETGEIVKLEAGK